jgi:hypothetical protein
MACITSELFLFHPRAFDIKPEKCSSMRTVQHTLLAPTLKNVKVISFPANHTSDLQPLDSDVLCQEKKYRKSLAHKMMAHMNM